MVMLSEQRLEMIGVRKTKAKNEQKDQNQGPDDILAEQDTPKLGKEEPQTTPAKEPEAPKVTTLLDMFRESAKQPQKAVRRAKRKKPNKDAAYQSSHSSLAPKTRRDNRKGIAQSSNPSSPASCPRSCAIPALMLIH